MDMGEMPKRKAHIHCSATVGEKNFLFFFQFFFRWVYSRKNFSKVFFEMLQVKRRIQGSKFAERQVSCIGCLSFLWSFAEISLPKKKNARHFEKNAGPNWSIFCDLMGLYTGSSNQLPKNELHPLTN